LRAPLERRRVSTRIESQRQRKGGVMWPFQRFTFATAIATSVAVAAFSVPVSAQNFPTKPVRIVVPFTPGGTSDVVARTLAQKMSESWGQPVIIETRTGAGGAIGTALVAKATPDGHTLLISSAAFVISAAMNPNLGYDPLKDFAGVARIGFSTTALIVPPALGVKTTKELIALGQAKPGHLIFSSAGVGSSTHMNGERFRLAADIKVRHVGYKGAADAMLEVMAARSHFAIVSLVSSLQFIKDGRLIALAVGTTQRSALLPDVPTIAETLPGYKRDGSHSLLAPAGTPLAVRKQISKEVARILSLPDVKERLENYDFVSLPSTPEEHEQILRADIATFGNVVKLAGLRPTK
jgi:tripartite-type tricarboxylate transporter receptor subunit TctC